MTTAPFFESGKTYRHGNERGTEGIFDVRYVGTAPAPFEYHAETLGVAFGWLWGPGPDSTWQGLGSYCTPDFADWEEIPHPPCGAQAGNRTCVITEPRNRHGKHIAADGAWWYETEPCEHDCGHMECTDGPTVYCGAADEHGMHCYWVADHNRPHEYEARP